MSDSSNSQKTPFMSSMQSMVDEAQNIAEDIQGKVWPASVLSVDGTNTIVTVQIEIQDDVITFPDVTCPMIGTEWIRYPIKKGTKGIVLSADLYIGAMSGLGGGQATLSDERGNLSMMVFIPIGNTAFTETNFFGDTDIDSLTLYSPNGIILSTADGETSLTLSDGSKGAQGGEKVGGVMISAPLGANCLGANLVLATSEADARAKGVPTFGFYYEAGGAVFMVEP
jgi:hypothetical protein